MDRTDTSSFRNAGSDQNKDQFVAVNAKLDRILAILELKTSKKALPEAEEIVEKEPKTSKAEKKTSKIFGMVVIVLCFLFCPKTSIS